MQVVKYSTPRLVSLVFCMAGFAWLGAWMWGAFYGKGAFLGAMFFLIGVVGGLETLRKLAFGGIVLEFDRHTIAYHGLFGVRRVRWSEVEDILLEKQTYNGITSNTFLKIYGPFGGLGYASVTQSLLTAKHRPLEKLVAQMAAAQEGAFDTPDHPEHSRPFPGSPAARSRGVVGEAPAAAPAARAGFGRKGL